MMKLMKQLMCLLLAMLTAAALSTAALGAEFNGASLDGVVFLAWEGVGIREDDWGDPVLVDNAYAAGSAFFVGTPGENPQYLVTNCHVVQDFIDVDDLCKEYADILINYYDVINKSGKTLFPLYVYYDQEEREEAYLVGYDKEKDLAILRLAAPTDKRSALTLMESAQDYVGKAVWAIGFPGVADRLADSVTAYGKSDASVTVGSINRIITESGTGRRIYQTDAKTRGGNSGGPLVDENAAVLGINTFIAADWVDSNLNYAVCIDNLLPLLKQNNVPYTLYTPPEPDPWWVTYRLYLILGGAALGLIAVILVIIFAVSAGNKKKQQSNEILPPTPEPVVPESLPVLRSMSAQHGGQTVPLSRQPILVGRDVASCRIVFREGTNGVSSRHCQVAYDEVQRVFVLTDLKSTYGTFLSSGQQLPPHVPYTLRPRDSFYLGERDNMLYVDMESASSPAFR